MSEELKPCPFCGGKPRIDPTFGDVICDGCGLIMEGKEGDSKADVLIAWNRRVEPRAEKPEVEP
jgi:Lar family restriction alleviation protein